MVTTAEGGKSEDRRTQQRPKIPNVVFPQRYKILPSAVTEKMSSLYKSKPEMPILITLNLKLQLEKEDLTTESSYFRFEFVTFYILHL